MVGANGQADGERAVDGDVAAVRCGHFVWTGGGRCGHKEDLGEGLDVVARAGVEGEGVAFVVPQVPRVVRVGVGVFWACND